jgi:hypothetical protein
MRGVYRLGRVVALVALFSLPLFGGAVGHAESELPKPTDAYWLGPYFAGMRLTYTSPTGTGFAYGDCELPEGEGGCSVPAQVQNSTSCDRNPLAIDRVPFRVFLVRGGGLAVEYERGAVDVGTGNQTVTLYTEFELMGAALRDFRRKSEPTPQPLPPPAYPPAALRELKRVTVAKKRFVGIGEIARAIGLPPAEVRVRLQIAELLPPETLAHVRPPKLSIPTLERLRQLAFRTEDNLPRAARLRGISVASLRKKIAPVRGLTGYCWPLEGH